MLPGNDGGQSDAPQAYTQALFNFGSGEQAIDTWVSLPKEEWPKEWHGKYHNPVVKLRLALYGHPLAGLFWERHYRQHLLEIGFKPVDGWECLYWHPTLHLLLSVYVDDFKMAGKSSTLAQGWQLIQKHIRLDPPIPFSDYLGCGQ